MRHWLTSIGGFFRTLTPDQRLRVRRILIIAWLLMLLALAIWVLRNQRDDLRDIWTNLKNADRTWLAIALFVEVAGITSVAWTFKLTLRRLGHRVSTRFLTFLHLQRAGVNFAAPFGGAVTAYVFTDRLRRKAVPAEDALLTLAIRTASVWGATIVVLVATAALSEQPLLIAGAVALLIAAIVLAFVAAKQGQGDWKTILRWSKRLPKKQADRVAAAVARFKSHDLTPADLLGSIGTTLLTRTATMTLIYSCVRALGFETDIYTIFIAYVASFVAGRLVPFLYGMGAVEGSLSLALQRGGVPVDIAIGATLLFRFFDFFLPSVIGLALYTWDERHRVTGSSGGIRIGRPPIQ
jgi:phosphatidylglycerol lysyltransferase